VKLLTVGAGPTLDYPDATAFLATFEGMIEKLRTLRMQRLGDSLIFIAVVAGDGRGGAGVKAGRQC
jgi:hypothetical protein